MSSNVSSRHRAGATRILAAMAILAVLSLATPSAFAGISLFGEAFADGYTSLVFPLASGASTGNLALGNFTYSLTAIAIDTPAFSNLTTNTGTITNMSTTTDTLTLEVTGVGYSGPGAAGDLVNGNFAIAANGVAPYSSVTDTTTGLAWGDPNNRPFGETIPFGALTGAPTGLGGAYGFPSGGVGPVVPFTLTAPVFSLTEELVITLGGGDSVNFPIMTTVVPTPEPSTMAIASIGALALIGYRLWRRKALGA
jgi:PEP-CTERM motif